MPIKKKVYLTRGITFEVSEIDTKIDAEFSKADEEHKSVVNLAKLNKKLYKKVSALMKEASHLSTEADKKHKEFVDIRKKADNQHSKAMEMLETLRAHRKTANEERQASWKVVKDHRKNIKKELYDPKKLDSVADDALQQLMSGGKSTFNGFNHFAGGFAKRMWPLTKNKPKQLLDVAGKPMLSHVIDSLTKISPNRIIVSVNSFFESQFKSYLSSHDLPSNVELYVEKSSSEEEKLEH